ncbi:hypothetical protein HYV71_05125 [Candidatus Uhrbacteria bacterium]|nr:hypothetical protein [Candidatus Uhrbacteria bacterium]
MPQAMYRFLFLCAVFLLPLVAFADEGSTSIPDIPCEVEKISCGSYQDKGLCDQYLNDPAYTLAGGEVGASVQNYEFCPTDKVTDAPKVSEMAFLSVAVLIFIGGVIGFGFMMKRSKGKKQ